MLGIWHALITCLWKGGRNGKIRMELSACQLWVLRRHVTSLSLVLLTCKVTVMLSALSLNLKPFTHRLLVPALNTVCALLSSVTSFQTSICFFPSFFRRNLPSASFRSMPSSLSTLHSPLAHITFILADFSECQVLTQPLLGCLSHQTAPPQRGLDSSPL